MPRIKRNVPARGTLLLLAVAIWIGLGAALPAAEPIETGFVSKIFQDESGSHRYVVWVPHNYDPDRPWPVMLFLHGAGERGTDGLAQIHYGLGPMIKRWGAFPWIVVFPQAENRRIAIEHTWSPDAPDGRRALEILAEVERDYHTDPHHRVLTGWSMGGHGSYLMAARYPQKWSAVVPVAGWADPSLAPALANVPIWAIHGTSDELVDIEKDATLIEAIRAAGGDPFHTKLPERGHSIWRTVYASANLLKWMSNPAHFADRDEPPPLDPNPTVEMSAKEAAGPFVPAIIVQDAVVVHLGRDVFEDLSHIATTHFAEQPFAGTLPPMATSTSAMGIPVQVSTSALQYHVPVLQVKVEPTPRGTLLVQAAIANARATVGRTHIQGWLCSAVAGPMTIWVGTRRPLIVEAEVEPYITGETFHVRTEDVSLSIAPDNWWVSPPGVYSTLLSDQQVSKSLVQGVYAKKSEIEQSLRQAIAEALNNLSLELPPVSGDQLLTGLWPVPAYRPRARPQPARLEIDEDGMAVAFNLAVAALDPWSPPKPRRIDFQLATDDLPDGGVAIEADQQLLEILSQQLIRSGVAHINVVDVPNSEFADLADRDVLARAIPAVANLPAGAELRTELYLRQPLDLNTAGGTAQSPEQQRDFTVIELKVPELVAVISVRRNPGDRWQDWAELRYSIRQSMRLEVGLELRQGREVISHVTGPPTISVQGHWLGTPPKQSAFNEPIAVSLFRSRWIDWWDPAEPTALVIPDLEFRGYSRRLDRLVTGTEGMVAIFEKPETVITNRSNLLLTYRIRRANGQWSEPLSLPPGEKQSYRTSQPLAYMSDAGATPERYNIPIGREVTFKKRDNGQLGLVLEALPRPLDRQDQIPGTGK